MSSILTNNSAMNALATMRNINNSLDSTQNRISTGLKVNSGKDNAAYFAISESMKGDSGMLKSINESLTLTKNSVATARLGAENFKDLATQFTERVAFAQGNEDGLNEIKDELDEIVKQMGTTISQATFNGENLVAASDTESTPAAITVGTGAFSGNYEGANGAVTKTVVTGVSRSSGSFGVTTIEVDGVDLNAIYQDFKEISEKLTTNYFAESGDPAEPSLNAAARETYLQNTLKASEGLLDRAVSAATTLGIGEKAIETQQEFLNKLSDNLDSGVGSMVDANMEEEAARLQALQVQQQLATQSLTMANQKPQNILSLFR